MEWKSPIEIMFWSDDERVLLVLVCSGRDHVVCVYVVDMKARHEGGDQRGGDLAAAARHAKQSLSTVSTTFCTSGP